MNLCIRIAAAGLLAAAGAASAGNSQFWTNTVGQGFCESISNNGVAAGSFQAFGGQYFVWTAETGAFPIGGVAAGNGVGGQATISHDGAFVSGTVLNMVSGLHEAAIYDVAGEAWTAIGTLGFSCDAESSSGWGISGDGLQIVGLAWVENCRAHAFIGNEAEGLTDLGSTVPNRSTRANAADFDGNVVVGWQDAATGFRQGAVWVDGVQHLITTPDGFEAQEAGAVSSNGRWVAGRGYAGPFGIGTSYRWDTETQTSIEIPNLEVGAGTNLTGTAVSEDGKTIVGATWPFGPALLGNGVIWREGVGTTLFKDYLIEQGVEFPANFNFAFVADMSPNGEWFCGWGHNGSLANAVSWFVHIPGPVATGPDLNGDGFVDSLDLNILLAGFGCTAECAGDADGDGDVDSEDLNIILGAFGTAQG